MKIESRRVMVSEDLEVTVTVHSTGVHGHSKLSNNKYDVEHACDVAASDIQDKIRRMPERPEKNNER